MSNELKVSDHLIGAHDITLEDCIKRANSKATTSSYSGNLLDNKDLRRVIFLVNELSRPPEPKKMNDREKTMERWDFWRNEIANGCTSSQPRDWFESLFCEPEPKTEWISVDDRFPKNSGVVLCVSRGYIGAFTGWYEDGIWYDHADGEEFIVTHWQPLPDAPICDEVKKEGNDE